MKPNMFCYQCQETVANSGCTVKGVCGKTSNTANLQDLLIYVTKGLSLVTHLLRKEGRKVDKIVNHYITVNLFTTITNANFDDEVFVARIIETITIKEKLLKDLDNTENLHPAAKYRTFTLDEITSKSTSSRVGVLATEDEDVRSLRELITYGLKGMAAYVEHANVLGFDKEEIDIFIQDTLAKLLDDSLTVDELVALTLETGKFGVEGMALLDTANTTTYGNLK